MNFQVIDIQIEVRFRLDRQDEVNILQKLLAERLNNIQKKIDLNVNNYF